MCIVYVFFVELHVAICEFMLTDGKLVPLDKVWDLCPAYFQKHLKDNKWTTLTQQV